MTRHPPLPGALVLGAPKAGTTTLARWLEVHQGAHLAPEKEVSFFDLHHGRGEVWYRSRFAGAAPGQVALEATPAYLYVPEALDRAAAMLPGARLVVLLREPADRVWSHYWYFRMLGIETRRFERVLRDELDDPGDTPGPGIPVGYLDMSCYVRHLPGVTARWSREQLLVLFTDELRRDPAGTYARVCEHLGIKVEGPPADVGARNVGTRPRWPWLQVALHRLHVGDWPGGLGRAVTRLNAQPGGYPALQPDRRAALRSWFAATNRELADWLDRPLPDDWAVADDRS